MVMLYAGGYVMGAWDSFWFVMGRAWDISFSLMGPVTILLWLSAMVGIIWMHVRRPRLASLMAVFTEADVIAGRPGPTTRLRVLVSQGG